MAGAPDWRDRPLLLEIDKSPLLMASIDFVIHAIMAGPRSSSVECDFGLVAPLDPSERRLRTECHV